MSLSVQGQPRSHPAPGPPPPACRGLTGPFGGEGCCMAWRLKGQIGSKAKVKQKAHVTTPGERTKSVPPTFATQAGGDCSAELWPCVAVTSESHGELGPRAPWPYAGLGPCMYNACQRAVLSESSSESLFSVTEGRSLCSRGLSQSAGLNSMWMEGTSK